MAQSHFNETSSGLLIWVFWFEYSVNIGHFSYCGSCSALLSHIGSYKSLWVLLMWEIIFVLISSVCVLYFPPTVPYREPVPDPRDPVFLPPSHPSRPLLLGLPRLTLPRQGRPQLRYGRHAQGKEPAACWIGQLIIIFGTCIFWTVTKNGVNDTILVCYGWLHYRKWRHNIITI